MDIIGTIALISVILCNCGAGVLSIYLTGWLVRYATSSWGPKIFFGGYLLGILALNGLLWLGLSWALLELLDIDIPYSLDRIGWFVLLVTFLFVAVINALTLSFVVPMYYYNNSKTKADDVRQLRINTMLVAMKAVTTLVVLFLGFKLIFYLL